MLIRIVTGIEKTKNDETLHDVFTQGVKQQALARLALALNGATCIEGVGSYKHFDGRIVVERCLVFEVVVGYYTEDNAREVRLFAEWLRDRLEQESVLVDRIDNNPDFI